MVAAASGILQTKLTPPPVRADRIPRPRLTRQFSVSLERPLVLVCAPAGYGKTTMLSEWLVSDAGRDVSFAWLSLDEDDNDPARFLTYVISSLTRLEGIDSDEILSLLNSPQAPAPGTMLALLINHLEASPQPLVLVLDDYHVIVAQAVHNAVTFLLEHLPPQMHLVLISREDPPFPLARLRGRDQLMEIRADDLRFTADEASAFLERSLGIHLNTQQIAELERRTEGWIAGLQLAALAMKGREDIAGFISAFTGSHRFILDYLIEEVLSHQSEDLQNFLLESSILNRLCGPLCDAVTGRSDGQSTLEYVERGNMFLIMLDDERYWYRYHHLFAEVLRNRLKHRHTDRLPELHRRASAWFEANDWVGEAVEHAILAQDSDRVARLLEAYGDRIWRRGEVTTVLRWMESLPDEVMRMRPKLGLNHAFMLTAIDAFVEAEKRLIEVERVLAELPDADVATQTALQGQAATIRATISIQLDYPKDITLAAGNQALAQLPESLVNWRAWAMMIVGNAHFALNSNIETAQNLLEEAIDLGDRAGDLFTMLVALAYLTQIYLIQGKLRQIEAICRSLFERAGTLGWKGQPALGVARMSRAWVRYERNDLAGAHRDVIEGQLATEGYELKRVSLPSYVLLACLERLSANDERAREIMQGAVDMMERENLTPASIAVSAWQAWMSLKQGDIAAANAWAQAIEPTTADQLDPGLEFEHMTLARIQMAQGRLDAAQDLLTRLYAAASAGGRKGRVIAIRALQALALKQQGRGEDALEALAHALALAGPEGYVRTFVDEGVLMADLLRLALLRGVTVDYVSRLLAAFDDSSPSTSVAQSRRWIGDGLEPLSERELEVLRLIADGASNREIAAQLFVSIGTVKKHVSNIFVKLDAHSRTQVIAVARQHHLL
ncbi:MAG: hypothetical protein KJ065_07575 [Anaerolineae bacterium]|nr:hypothetical protein [Anaerolineae bacterium]